MKHAVVLLMVLAFLFMPLALLPLLNGYVVVAANELLDLNALSFMA